MTEPECGHRETIALEPQSQETARPEESRELTILFDGKYWIDGPPSGRLVVREMVEAWLKAFPSDEVTVAVSDVQVAVQEKDWPSNLSFLPLSSRLHPVANLIDLPRLAKRVGADWIIAQNFASPFYRNCVYVHDVLFKTNPEWFNKKERIYFSSIPQLARFADSVVTSSETEARRIRHSFPFLRSVDTSGLAVSPDLVHACASRPSIRDLQPNSFLLSVGRLNARKNIGRAIDAALDSGAANPQTPLVIVGQVNGRAERLSTRARLGEADGSIIFTGSISEQELAWLYANCRMFLYLSLGEGYGLPPLEALAFGSIVVVSDLEVFREVLGEYGDRVYFCDPEDVSAIVSTLQAVDQEISRSLAAKVSGQLRSRTELENDWKEVVVRLRASLEKSPSDQNRPKFAAGTRCTNLMMRPANWVRTRRTKPLREDY